MLTMEVFKKLNVVFMVVGMALLLDSCATVHWHPRHRHHPHRHRVVIVADRTPATLPIHEGLEMQECLTLTEDESYGSIE